MWICAVALYVVRLLRAGICRLFGARGVGLHSSAHIAACECGVGQLCCMVEVGLGGISPTAVKVRAHFHALVCDSTDVQHCGGD
jgi:hypothetical protein